MPLSILDFVLNVSDSIIFHITCNFSLFLNLIAQHEWLQPKGKGKALRSHRYESIVNERYDFLDKEKILQIPIILFFYIYGLYGQLTDFINDSNHFGPFHRRDSRFYFSSDISRIGINVFSRKFTTFSFFLCGFDEKSAQINHIIWFLQFGHRKSQIFV